MISAQAPANIALIKYMGKVPGADKNQPTNSSLSLTLPHLLTRVEIEPQAGSQDSWAPLAEKGWLIPELSEKGRERYLQHFSHLKNEWGIRGTFLVRSANNFPSDCGLASSASSFAALTLAASRLAADQNPDLKISHEQAADLSRKGSGSSIRSFYGPFCVWNSKGANEVDLGISGLRHDVIVVESGKKAVSSSEAHQRVLTSALFEGRVARAERRLESLVLAARAGQWRVMFDTCWDEFHDMHSLFSTSSPPFSYIDAQTEQVLQTIESSWRDLGDGPIVTMDAGANVHLLFRSDQIELRKNLLAEFGRDYKVYSSE